MAVRGERDRTAIPDPATKHITSVSPVALVDELRIRWVVDEGKWGDCKSWWWSVHRMALTAPTVTRPFARRGTSPTL